MSKKWLQAFGMIMVLSILMTSCTAAPTATVAPTAASVQTEAPVVDVPEPIISGQINILGWEGYDDPEAFKPFYDQYGVINNTTYIGNNDELITKYKAGGPGTYDVGNINGRYYPMMAKMGMIQALDESKLPNLKDLFPAWKERGYGYVDGKLYAIPLSFGPTVLCYRADLVPEPGWDFYTKPEFQGKYAVTNNPLANMYIWAMTLGLGQDASKWTQDDLQKIKARGMEEFKYAATMYTGGGGEQKDLLVRGDVVLTTDCWDQVAIDAQKEGVDVKTALPPGPIKVYVDVYFIFTGAKNLETAYAWTNYAIGADAQAVLAKNYGSAPANMKAFDLISTELKNSLGFDKLNDTITRADFNVLPNPDAQPPYVTIDDLYTVFEEIKTGSGK